MQFGFRDTYVSLFIRKKGEKMTDLQIENSIKKIDIKDVASKIGLNESDIEKYGNDKAKINLKKYSNKCGKLILVTSINPTPYGEGKTTLSIGINDALNRLNKKSIVVLREPSLGPVFGIKGGATGGGYSQIIPSIDINLHFTGDIHAVESANNLLCAAIDNHIYFGNRLKFKNILFKRCMDMNDRALRNIIINNNLKKVEPRDESFQITTASEIMAILCLCTDINDLKRRIGNILIGIDINNKPIYASSLNIQDAMTILLKDAIKPNLVQTLENNPAIVHGGPFANVAHGCNSVIATKLALNLGDYVVTEAGFGSDLGCEKFFDIKCKDNNLNPDLVILNVTIRGLKHNGLCPKEELTKYNLEYLKKGISNLNAHINIIKKFSNNIMVVLNKFNDDIYEEIKYIKDYCFKINIPFEISEAYMYGSEGALSVAKTALEVLNNKNKVNFMYNNQDSIKDKIYSLATNVYNANEIKYSDKALEKIKFIENIGYSDLPICVAKTQYSISDDPNKSGYPSNYKINITDLHLCTGSQFIIVYMNNIITMPGLSSNPNYENMYIDNNLIKGII